MAGESQEPACNEPPDEQNLSVVVRWSALFFRSSCSNDPRRSVAHMDRLGLCSSLRAADDCFDATVQSELHAVAVRLDRREWPMRVLWVRLGEAAGRRGWLHCLPGMWCGLATASLLGLRA